MPGTFAYAAATNTVTVTGGTSGSPADFASFVAADRAGAGTSLLAAWSPNSHTKALTYQVRPVELLALLISFVVAGKTAETDYIFITGTDWLGAAQTESINVSAGNGTYVSTKRWRTITNIDCSDNAAGGGTVWANGTVAVTQPIWGVIWDKGNGQYGLKSKFIVGNGSTATYFATSREQIVFHPVIVTASYQNFIEIKSVATFQTGINSTYKYLSYNGSTLFNKDNGYDSCYLVYNNGGTFNSYASKYSSINSDDRTHGFTKSYLDTFDYVRPRTDINSDIYGSISLNTSGFLITGGSPVFDKYSSFRDYNGITFNAVAAASVSSPKLIGCYGYFLYCQSLTGTNYVVDLDTGGATITVSWNADAGNTGQIYLQYTFNLHLTDLAGNNISGAIVTLKDAAAATVFSVSTGADGKITFSGQDSSSIANAVTRTRYYYSGGAQSSYKGPWTLTITKTGYQDYTDVITIDRKMDLEVALSYVRTSPTNLGLVPLGIKQVAI